MCVCVHKVYYNYISHNINTIVVCYCVAVVCSSLKDPKDGRVSFQSTVFGSVALYFCEQGFTINGEESRTCALNGEWTGKQPTCERKELDT